MSVGHLKREKSAGSKVGSFLEKIGVNASKAFDHALTQKIFGAVGQGIGMATGIPLAGTVGKAVGKATADALSYGFGTVGEFGKALQGEASATDVLTYAPRRAIDDVVNSNLGQVIQGKKTLPDGIMDHLSEQAMLDVFAPVHDAIFGKPDHSRTRLWVNKNGDASTTWKPGYNRIMYGDVVSKPAPVYNGSESVWGTYQGQVYRKGVDDAAWRQLQKQGKVK